MKTLYMSLLVFTTACGQVPAKETDAATTATAPATSQPVKAPTVAETAPGESEPVVPAVAPHRVPTKAETLQLLNRIAFDLNFKKGNMFEVPGLYYVMKGGTGTMGYADVQYAPGAKDVRATCPSGFTIADQIELSIAENKGLLEALPSGKDWVWTSDKSGDMSGRTYNAMPAHDITRAADNFTFVAGFFYSAMASQLDAQVYCVMSVHDLVSVSDMPDYLQETLQSLALSDD